MHIELPKSITLENSNKIYKKRKRAFAKDLTKKVSLMCWLMICFQYCKTLCFLPALLRCVLQVTLVNPFPVDYKEEFKAKIKKVLLVGVMGVNFMWMLITVLWPYSDEYFAKMSVQNELHGYMFISIIGEAVQCNNFKILCGELLVFVLQCLLYAVTTQDHQVETQDPEQLHQCDGYSGNVNAAYLQLARLTDALKEDGEEDVQVDSQV